MALAFLSVTRAAPASAQGEPPAPVPSRLHVRVGPLTIDPTLALTNIGVDQNVFNEPTDLNPKSDFTFTVTPVVNLRLRFAKTVLSGSANEDLVWYQTYSSERSINSTLKAAWYIPLNRLSFNLNARHANLRDRPGFEIDARSQRTETGFDGIAEMRVMPKTFVGVNAQRLRVDYDKDAVFLGNSLQNELNRVSTSAGLSLRYKLTPLTSVSIVATRSEDRFEFSSLRDSNTTAGAVLISFDPLGILSGSASFGYTNFQPVTPGLPNFVGPTAAVNVSYRLLGTMRISVGAIRDVSYSYDINQPYYVESGVSGSVSRAVAGPFDVVVRGGVQSLAYRDRAGAVIAVSNRVDNVTTYGGGIGYRLGRGSRLGFNVDKESRLSDVVRRRYDNLRLGSSVTYGF